MVGKWNFVIYLIFYFHFCMWGSAEKASDIARGYSYVACDECHYFLTDSNYNTNTWLSYQWVQKWLNQQIRILLSAAIGDIKDYGVSQKWVGKYSILYTASKLCVAMSFTVWIFIVHEIIKRTFGIRIYRRRVIPITSR